MRCYKLATALIAKSYAYTCSCCAANGWNRLLASKALQSHPATAFHAAQSTGSTVCPVAVRFPAYFYTYSQVLYNTVIRGGFGVSAPPVSVHRHLCWYRWIPAAIELNIVSNPPRTASTMYLAGAGNMCCLTVTPGPQLRLPESLQRLCAWYRPHDTALRCAAITYQDVPPHIHQQGR